MQTIKLSWIGFCVKLDFKRNEAEKRLGEGFLLVILLIYISNVISLPSFLSTRPLTYHPFPCFYEGTLPPPSSTPPPLTHPLPPHNPSIPLLWCIKPPQDHGLPSHWCQIRQFSATYATGVRGSSMCTLWLVV